MKGYLIYHSKEAVRNQAFIKLFEEAGRKIGLTFTYVSYEQYQNAPLPDFVLNRTREAVVSRWYEERNIPVFHSSRITEIGNQKQKTLEHLQEHLSSKVLEKKWAPDWLFLPKERIDVWIKRLRSEELVFADEDVSRFLDRYNCVMKSVDGHGGTEVAEFPDVKDCVMLQNRRDSLTVMGNQLQPKREEMIDFLHGFEGKDCILQEKIRSNSEDVRVYILGDRIYQAVRRKGKNDFRSNFSLGGTVSAYDLTSKQKMWVQEFLNAFQKEEMLGLAGLDFIIDTDGRLVFNELEEMVGCRMLYQYTNYNVVEDYVRWIQKFVENNGCH